MPRRVTPDQPVIGGRGVEGDGCRLRQPERTPPTQRSTGSRVPDGTVAKPCWRSTHVGGGVGRADAVLVGLARHQRRVIVEEPEAEDPPPGRVGQQHADGVETAGLVGLVCLLLAQQQHELRGPRRAGHAQNRPQGPGEPFERVLVQDLSRQQPAPGLRAARRRRSPERASARETASGARSRAVVCRPSRRLLRRGTVRRRRPGAHPGPGSEWSRHRSDRPGSRGGTVQPPARSPPRPGPPRGPRRRPAWP